MSHCSRSQHGRQWLTVCSNCLILLVDLLLLERALINLTPAWMVNCAFPIQAGEMLLREHVLIHLDHAADKLNALLAMTAKLFSLAAGLCADDNADALSHHEALLPGALLSKFMADKLAECLAVFKRQASSHLFPLLQKIFADPCLPFITTYVEGCCDVTFCGAPWLCEGVSGGFSVDCSLQLVYISRHTVLCPSPAVTH